MPGKAIFVPFLGSHTDTSSCPLRRRIQGSISSWFLKIHKRQKRAMNWNNNPMELDPDYKLGVESVRQPQIPGVHSGAIVWYEELQKDLHSVN